VSLTSGQHAEGPLVVRPTPGRTFWLLALVALPALNTAVFIVDFPDLGLPDIFWLLAFLAQGAVEVGVLARALSRRGLTGWRWRAWLATGVAIVLVATGLCSVVALAVVVLIGLNNCGTLESGCL
jgi:hypothetical protein